MHRVFTTIVLALAVSACGGGGSDAPAKPDAVDAYVGRWSQCDAALSKLTAWNIEKLSPTTARLTIAVGSMTGPGCDGPAWDKQNLLDATLKFSGTKDYSSMTWDRVELTSGATTRKELIVVSDHQLLTSTRADGTSQGASTDADGYPDSFAFYRIARGP